MTHRTRITQAAVVGFGLGILSLGTSHVALADHFAVGVLRSVHGTERTTLQGRFEWGGHHGLRIAYEDGINDRNFQSFDAEPGTSHSARTNGNGTMYSLTYEYNLNGRQAASTWFLGAGPCYIRGHASAFEERSFYSPELGFGTAILNQSWNNFDAHGLLAYAGCRAALKSSLRLTATLEGLWSNENYVWIEPRQYKFDFDGLSLQLGFDFGF